MVANNKADWNLLLGFSSIGALECALLSSPQAFNFQIGSVCSDVSACTNVLNGPFSKIPVVDIPLSAVAFFAYLIVSIIAFGYNNQPNKILEYDSYFRTTLLVISSSMITFSGYLMIVLFFSLHSWCTYCIFSAILSTMIALFTWKNVVVGNRTISSVIILSSSLITAAVSSLLFYTTTLLYPTNVLAVSETSSSNVNVESKDVKKDYEPPPITKPSSDQAMMVARKLKEKSARFYGAYWCSHCYNQKQTLGIEAKPYYEYIECDKQGNNSRYDLCRLNKVEIYTNNTF